jgi:hypothetical protein
MSRQMLWFVSSMHLSRAELERAGLAAFTMAGEFVISLPLSPFIMRLQLWIARNEHWTAGIGEVHRRLRRLEQD